MSIPTHNMQMAKCIEETGKRLSVNNDDIIKYLCSIEEERENLELIIQRQYQERKKIEAEIEKLTYKLCLINKSLSMRIKAKNNYDRTIEEIRNHYKQLVDSSNTLRNIVEKQQQELDGIMNKKTGTGAGGGEEIKMLYLKSKDRVTASDDCTCINELPTKDNMAQPDRFTPPPPLPAGSETVVDDEPQSGEETFVFPEEPASFTDDGSDKTRAARIPAANQPNVGENQDLPVITASVVDESSRRESDEDDEIEVNTVNAENNTRAQSADTKSSDDIRFYQPSIDTDILGEVNSYTVSIKDSFEKSNPLPELPKGEDQSTGVLIQRLKMGLNLEADGEGPSAPRHKSKIIHKKKSK